MAKVCCQGPCLAVRWLVGDSSHGVTEDQVLACYYFSVSIGSLGDIRPTAEEQNLVCPLFSLN